MENQEEEEVAAAAEAPPPNDNIPAEVVEDVRGHLRTLFANWRGDQIERALTAARGALANANAAPAQLIDLSVETLLQLTPPPATPPGAAGARFNPDQLSPESTKTAILDRFPRVCPRWLEEQVEAGRTLTQLVELILDPDQDVPKLPPAKKKRVERPAEASEVKETNDIFNTNTKNRSMEYKNAAISLLALQYPMVPVGDLRTLFARAGSNYAPVWRCLRGVRPPAVVPVPFAEGRNGLMRINTLKRGRSRSGTPFSPGRLPDSLRRELEAVQEATKGEEEGEAGGPSTSKAFSSSFPGSPAVLGEGDFWECPICCLEVRLRRCVACRDGHLFCPDCVKSQAQEAVYGQAQTAQVVCLESGCSSVFSRRDLTKLVEADVIRKLDERLQEESVNAAGLDGLERCKYCNFGMVMEVPKELDKVFQCENCEAEICRVCGRDWDENHLGVPCEQLEKDDAAAARRKLEEELSSKVIRYCPSCKVPFEKQEGCNKMTCRCGMTMCYLCRAEKIDYYHFCRHVREPGQACEECSSCFLWADSRKHDREQLKKVAKEAKNDARFADLKEVGGGLDEFDSPPVKIQKIQQRAAVPMRAPVVAGGRGPVPVGPRMAWPGGAPRQQQRHLGPMPVPPQANPPAPRFRHE